MNYKEVNNILSNKLLCGLDQGLRSTNRRSGGSLFDEHRLELEIHTCS